MTPDTSIIAKLLHVNGMDIEKVEVQGDYRIKDGTLGFMRKWLYMQDRLRVCVESARFAEGTALDMIRRAKRNRSGEGQT